MQATDAKSLIAAAGPYQAIDGMTAAQVIIYLLAYWVNNNLQPAPVLSAGLNSVTWVSAYTPPFWNVYYSTDGGNTWTLKYTETGTSNSANMLSLGWLVYVVGVASASGPTLTLPSNSVTVG